MSTMNIEALKQQYGGMPSAGGGAPAAGVGAPVSDQPLVLLSKDRVKSSPPSTYAYMPSIMESLKRHESLTTTTKVGKVGTITDAMRKFDKMSVTEQRKMLRLLALGGFAGAINLEDIDEAIKQSTQLDARNAYMNLLETASDVFMNSGSKVTPDDVLQSAIAYRLRGTGIEWNGDLSAFDNGVKGFGESTDQSKTVTTTYTSSDVLNPKNAKGLVRSILQQELSRDPTKAEYEDFLSALMAAERQNPDVTTTTQQFGSDGQLISSNSRTQQGINEEGLAQIATEKARSKPGWAEWQAIGTYAPVIYSSLGSAVPGT